MSEIVEIKRNFYVTLTINILQRSCQELRKLLQTNVHTVQKLYNEFSAWIIAPKLSNTLLLIL